jgi:hypothetical protein
VMKGLSNCKMVWILCVTNSSPFYLDTPRLGAPTVTVFSRLYLICNICHVLGFNCNGFIAWLTLYASIVHLIINILSLVDVSRLALGVKCNGS